MIRALALLALVAVLVLGLWPGGAAWIGGDQEPDQVETPDRTRLAFPPSVAAPKTSPRPQARECARTVTNNPAIQDWRRSIGC